MLPRGDIVGNMCGMNGASEFARGEDGNVAWLRWIRRDQLVNFAIRSDMHLERFS